MNFIKLALLVLIASSIAACGGGGGGEGSNDITNISLNKASLSFTAAIGQATTAQILTVTFKGDGLIAGYAPGISPPAWLVVTQQTLTATTSTFSFSTNNLASLGTSNTSIRFVTGKADGSHQKMVDLPISLTVTESFSSSSSIRSSISSSSSQINSSISSSSRISSSFSSSSSSVSTLVQINDVGTTVENSTPFSLSFNVTDTAIDTIHSKMYFSDKDAKRLYVVDLASGLTEKYFSFQNMPESIAITPDGNELYVALLTQEHSSYWWESDQSGFIAMIDTVEQTYNYNFPIKIDPFDLVVTNESKLVVTSGSGQWTSIYAYNGSTGEELGHASIRQASRLALRPVENFVYAADTDLSPSEIQKFDINGLSITALGDSPYHGDHRMDGDVWVTPDGNHLITRGGDVFLSSDMTFVASMTINTSIKSLAFDTTTNSAVVIDTNNNLVKYSLDTWLELSTLTTSLVNPQFVGVTNGDIYVVSQGLSHILIQKY